MLQIVGRSDTNRSGLVFAIDIQRTTFAALPCAEWFAVAQAYSQMPLTSIESAIAASRNTVRELLMSSFMQTPADGKANSPMDQFLPNFDVRKRHETMVHAPATIVSEEARRFDMESILLVRWIFRLRALLLGAKTRGSAPRSLVAETLRLGWVVLYDEPDRILIEGAACQPWQADVEFKSIPPSQFANYHEPDQVKIAWTLEASQAGSELTRLASETRVIATDEQARQKFRRYWRFFGIGILMIRWLVLPAIRRIAERRWRDRERGAAADCICGPS
jgi:hypothetical protein